MHTSIYMTASIAKSEITTSPEIKPVIKKYNAIDPSSRSSYMCRKCRAHGQLLPVKRHKRNCPFRFCDCPVCYLVNYGRKIVAKQIALYRDQKSSNGPAGSGSSIGGSTSEAESSTGPFITHRINTGGLNQHPPSLMSMEGLEQQANLHHLQNGSGKSSLLGFHGNEVVGRTSTTGTSSEMTDEGPNCRRCRNHGKSFPWKGHKKKCPHANCPCNQCILIEMRKDNEKHLREKVQDTIEERQHNQVTSSVLTDPSHNSMLPPPLIPQNSSIYSSPPNVTVGQTMMNNQINNEVSTTLRNISWASPSVYRTTIPSWDNRIPTDGQAMSYGNPYNGMLMPSHFPPANELINTNPWSGYL